MAHVQGVLRGDLGRDEAGRYDGQEPDLRSATLLVVCSMAAHPLQLVSCLGKVRDHTCL